MGADDLPGQVGWVSERWQSLSARPNGKITWIQSPESLLEGEGYRQELACGQGAYSLQTAPVSAAVSVPMGTITWTLGQKPLHRWEAEWRITRLGPPRAELPSVRLKAP